MTSFTPWLAAPAVGMAGFNGCPRCYQTKLQLAVSHLVTSPHASELLEHYAEENLLVVTYSLFLRFFASCVLFGDDLTPQHMIGLNQLASFNIGISIFEYHPTKLQDGIDRSGWHLNTWMDSAHL